MNVSLSLLVEMRMEIRCVIITFLPFVVWAVSKVIACGLRLDKRAF